MAAAYNEDLTKNMGQTKRPVQMKTLKLPVDSDRKQLNNVLKEDEKDIDAEFEAALNRPQFTGSKVGY